MLDVTNIKKYTPGLGDIYFFVYKEDNDVCNVTYKISKTRYVPGFPIDCVIAQNTLVFPTETAAEIYKQYLEILDKYVFTPDWSASHNYKYFIGLNHADKEPKLKVTNTFAFQSSAANVYFKTKKHAEQFINEVGEDNIKKFMFNFWGD